MPVLVSVDNLGQSRSLDNLANSDERVESHTNELPLTESKSKSKKKLKNNRSMDNLLQTTSTASTSLKAKKKSGFKSIIGQEGTGEDPITDRKHKKKSSAQSMPSLPLGEELNQNKHSRANSTDRHRRIDSYSGLQNDADSQSTHERSNSEASSTYYRGPTTERRNRNSMQGKNSARRNSNAIYEVSEEILNESRPVRVKSPELFLDQDPVASSLKSHHKRNSSAGTKETNIRSKKLPASKSNTALNATPATKSHKESSHDIRQSAHNIRESVEISSTPNSGLDYKARNLLDDLRKKAGSTPNSPRLPSQNNLSEIKKPEVSVLILRDAFVERIKPQSQLSLPPSVSSTSITSLEDLKKDKEKLWVSDGKKWKKGASSSRSEDSGSQPMLSDPSSKIKQNTAAGRIVVFYIYLEV
jgi:hypothetical protein